MKKAFINNFLLFNLIKRVILANADIFLLGFLHKSDIGSPTFKFTSIFMPKSFSHSVVFIVYSPILIPAGLFVLTNT